VLLPAAHPMPTSKLQPVHKGMALDSCLETPLPSPPSSLLRHGPTLPQADVLAHIGIVAGLLHQHFQVGVHVPHSVLHLLEGSGMVIAVVATVSAAVGEVLSMVRNNSRSNNGNGSNNNGNSTGTHEEDGHSHKQHQQHQHHEQHEHHWSGERPAPA
jgi:hypothetical protein